MATEKAKKSTLDDYDYMNENSIDAELKCSLCMQPFQVPVSAICGHTFCQTCINPWIARQSTCPTCRTRTSTEEFQPISTRIVLNQLERLLLRCKRCNEANIQRGNINDHEKRCPNQTVSCPAFDIKCTWKGTRSALMEHNLKCPFQQIRPAIDDLYEHVRNIYEPLVDELQTVRQELEKQLKRNNEQNRFLLAVFNKGKPMTDRCSGHTKGCPLQQSIQMSARNSMMQQIQYAQPQYPQQPSPFNQIKAAPINSPQRYGPSENQSARNLPTNNLFYCTICRSGVEPKDILLHHCEGGGICRTCVETYGNLSDYEQNLTDTR
ncbi:unnamed protein product [Rotaria sp. Silwood2]|nr:unnamed protein product [Rotaria sp. Silwood2]CAF4021398.1 unnamed protein product [Rotaria sp. Silwood2]